MHLHQYQRGLLLLTSKEYICSTIDHLQLLHSFQTRLHPIHAKQQLETLWVLFFVLYALEYVIKLILCGDMSRAYKSISFEQEAFSNENDVNYLEKRKLWCWIKYVFKMKKRTPFQRGSFLIIRVIIASFTNILTI